jgi:hypothetical protein
MKVYRILIIFSLIIASSFPAIAGEKTTKKWDSLMDISHRFTWYPQTDLQELLQKKSKEYGQSLEEYQNLLIAELTAGKKIKGLINPDVVVKDKPWKSYYRLAVSQFCIFLINNDKTYLQNANSIFSIISGKKELIQVSFWYYLLQAYHDLINMDSDAFVKQVFSLWNNCVVKLEIENLVKNSYNLNSIDDNDLPHYYENIAHLIIKQAIIERQMSNLSQLSIIIMSLNNKLSIEEGYKHFVEAIVARLQGLKSDNYNLNFAVAFVDATANQHEFEDETHTHLIVNKYNSVQKSYKEALSSADTNKGKSAILTQHMGFNSYLLRRLVDKDKLLTANSLSLNVVREAYGLVDQSLALYDQLAESLTRENGFLKEGFYVRDNCIKAMHQMWDSSAKLLMTLSLYYRESQEVNEGARKSFAEGPLIKYLSFFDRYTKANTEIVPDNAFFLAAYAASQLSDLYMISAKYSTSIQTNDWAFNYQVQAVELFPLDILGILKLAHQAEREGRHSLYLQYVVPLASRLRESSVTRIWSHESITSHRHTIAIITNVIPNIVDNAFVFIKALQQTEGQQTEEDLYNKMIIMSKLYTALKKENLQEKLPDILTSVVRNYNFNNKKSLKEIINDAIPPEFTNIVTSISDMEEEYHISKLKNELYASPDIKMHSFLRELYFENPDKIHHYLLASPERGQRYSRVVE